MQILISLPLAALIALAGRRALKRHPGLCYAAAALVALAAAWGTWTGAWSRLPVWGSHGLVPVFTRGALAMALFYIVMFANAVPNGAAFMRAVMPIRGELSILASILAVGHGAAQLKDPLEKLLAGALPGGGTAVQLALSLAALLVMLPLFATSFKRVRRRMEPGRWKRLQRLAYGFYALVFAHVLSYNLLRAVRGVPGAAGQHRRLRRAVPALRRDAGRKGAGEALPLRESLAGFGGLLRHAGAGMPVDGPRVGRPEVRGVRRSGGYAGGARGAQG